MSATVPVHHHATIDSTNLEAQRLAAGGVRGPAWIVADEQNSGRGRLGRTWVSAPGNLYSSLLFPTQAPAASIPQVAFVTALAVHDTVSGLCGTGKALLKWPNDCLLAGGKVAGILCETADDGQLVIGCGINVAHSPQGLAYATAHLGEHVKDIDVTRVFTVYSEALLKRLSEWGEGDRFPQIMAAWQERAFGLNRPVRVVAGSRTIAGTFAGLGGDGALIVGMADGSRETIYAGDVTFTATGP